MAGPRWINQPFDDLGVRGLYRALRLLAAAGQARAVAELAADGGLDAVRWAGPERISRQRRTVPARSSVAMT